MIGKFIAVGGDVMGNVLYTVGYGNQKPEDFVKRLKDAGVTWALDVRREGSGAWHGKYNQGMSMEVLLAMAKKKPIGYSECPQMGNTCDSLEEYAEMLDAFPEMIKDLSGFFDIAGACNETFCILCAERRAYKDGAVNCHRVYVADALVKILGDEWTVKHL
jgi:uncharacterized protein (DUF488 family)